MKDYIEREALLATYKRWLPQLVSKEDEGDRRGVETCIAVLEDVPTSDVVKDVLEQLIARIERELSQSNISDYVCEDGTIIKTDVGYVEDWFKEYAEILRRIGGGE